MPKQPETEAYARQVHKDFTRSEQLIEQANQQLINAVKTVGLLNKEGNQRPTRLQQLGIFRA